MITYSTAPLVALAGSDPDKYFRSSRAKYGAPIAIVYGTQRVKGVVLLAGYYMNNLAARVLDLGLFQAALCEGPISEVLAVWKEKTRTTWGSSGLTLLDGAGITAWSSGTTYVAGDWASSGGTNYVCKLGHTNHVPPNSTYWLARGSAATERAQSPWSYLTTSKPEWALGYGGTAQVVTQSSWGSNSLDQLDRASFEVSGFFTTATGSAQDVEPRSVIIDLLTNAEYGLGLPTSIIEDYSIPSGIPLGFSAGADGAAETSYTNWCQAKQLTISLALEDQRSVREVIEEIAVATDSLPVWSEGVLKMRPRSTEFIAASGGRPEYDGPTAALPVYDLGLVAGTDFLAEPGEDPVTIERRALAEQFNCYPVEYSARTPSRVDASGAAIVEAFNAYNSAVEDGTPDPADVAANGIRKAPVTSVRCITSRTMAVNLANTLAQRSVRARNVFRFRLGWKYALLEPGDYVTVTDAGLGLSRHLVRITEMEENEAGAFDVVAEDVAVVPTAAYPGLSLLLDNYAVFGSCTGAPCTAVSGTCTATPVGGSGTFTYAWTYVSGTAMTLSSTTAATVTFSKTSVTTTITATYRCTVTDTVTAGTASADVDVELASDI
jgi:hypothetical protein